MTSRRRNPKGERNLRDEVGENEQSDLPGLLCHRARKAEQRKFLSHGPRSFSAPC
jgi:hypothetical protein